MNKEQLKFSILNLVNYYVKNIIQLNLELHDYKNDEIEAMIINQSNALGAAFQNELNKLVDSAFVEEVRADE